MTDYILTALRFTQVLERNDQGRATREIRHRQGALITDLDEQEAHRLLVAGAIRPADEVPDVSDDEQVSGATTGGGAPAASSGEEPPAAGGTPAGPPRKPRVTATEEKWRAYAKSLPDITDEDLDGKDKDELIALVEAAEQQ